MIKNNNKIILTLNLTLKRYSYLLLLKPNKRGATAAYLADGEFGK